MGTKTQSLTFTTDTSLSNKVIYSVTASGYYGKSGIKYNVYNDTSVDVDLQVYTYDLGNLTDVASNVWDLRYISESVTEIVDLGQIDESLPQYTITVEPTPSDATVSITGATTSRTGNVVTAYKGTVLTITVSKTGYKNYTNTFTVTETKTFYVELEEERPRVTLTISPSPSNATVVLTSTGETQSGNSITVDSGSAITYSVSHSSLNTVTGTINPTYTQTLPIACTGTYTIIPDPSDATVTLTATGYVQSGNSITVPYNTTVSWEVSKTNYTPRSGSLNVISNLTDTVSIFATTFVFTISAIPSDAIVTLTAEGYTQEGNSIEVYYGTSVNWVVERSGYEGQSGTQIVTGNLVKVVTLNYIGTTIVTTDSSEVIEAGVYKYIAVGGGGSGITGYAAQSNRSFIGGTGGGGGGSGYIEVGTFSSIGETLTFNIGQGGINGNDGTSTIITGSSSGVIVTANGGKCPSTQVEGGDGGNGGGAAGYGGYNSGNVYPRVMGGAGGTQGGNGQSTQTSNLVATYAGGIGVYNTVVAYDTNTSALTDDYNHGNGGLGGKGLSSYEVVLCDPSSFFSATLADCYNKTSGGAGGGGSKIPTEGETPEYYGGAGGGGGGWLPGSAATMTESGAGTPGVGGNGGVVYYKYQNPTLVINPTPSDATVVLSATDATQIGNGIAVPINSPVTYNVSKLGYSVESDTVVVTEDEVINVTLTQNMYTFTINPTPSDAEVVLTAEGYTQIDNSITVPYNTRVDWSVSARGYETQSSYQSILSTSSRDVALVPNQYTVTINPTPADATVTLTASGYTQFNNSITVPYQTPVVWSVEKTGYETQSGTHIVTDTVMVEIELEETVNYTYTINPTPNDATVVLTAEGYTQSGNSITVPSGTTVTWTVSRENYIPQNGTYTVTETKTDNVILEIAVATFTYTINPTPNTAVVTLTATGYVQSGNSIAVPSGTVVSWSVSAVGYDTKSGTAEVTHTETVSVELESITTPPTLVTSTTTETLRAGTYRYIAIGAGGAGGDGSNLTAKRGTTVYGGGGGGSGYVSIGTFTTNGEDVTFAIGQGGLHLTTSSESADQKNGGATTITGETLGLIATANGGTGGGEGGYSSPAANGGTGGSGGGAGGKGYNTSATDYSNGGSGGKGGHSGESTAYFSGGVGSNPSAGSLIGNGGQTGNPFGAQVAATTGVVALQSSLLTSTYFDNVTVDTILEYLQGGGGGGGSTSSSSNSNGAGGSGGSGWFGGGASNNSSTIYSDAYSLGGDGGAGAVIYRKIG